MTMNLDPLNYPQAEDVVLTGVASGSPTASRPSTTEAYSPEWWRDRLIAKLRTRTALYEEFWRFYEGEQPLAFASDKFKETFGRRYHRLPANFMPLVVDAERERLIVQGFRFGTATAADKTIWRLWQANQLDAESQIAHEIALAKGMAYAAVDPFASSVSVTIEDPSETIVETSPGNRRERLAALKMWLDDEGYMRAYLFLPTEVYRWRAARRGASSISWQPYLEGDEDWPLTNRLGVVPIVPLPNRPRRDGTGRSEIAPVMGNQNAINKLRFDALVAAEFVAFPQRWATNIDIPVDPSTGKPIAPFRPGVDNLWTVRRPSPEESSEYGDKVPAPAFGQFPAADLGPYTDAIREEIGIMASNSRTPYHYLLGTPTSVPPSGESLKSSEAPLVRKVVAQSVHFGEGWEETMRVALIADGQVAKARTDGETIWADPETRNEAARTDALMKQYAQGLLADDFTMEELGYSQQAIERNAAQKSAQPTNEAAPPPTPDVPVPVDGSSNDGGSGLL